MQYIAFLLNLPWSTVGLITALLSVPRSVQLHRNPLAIVFKVRSFWWYTRLPGRAQVRGSANGHVIRLGPLEQQHDLEHELIHVEQAIREPLIHPFLYAIETHRKGYRQNKYEVEAYEKSGNEYKTK